MSAAVGTEELFATPVVHAAMYRNYRPGTLCREGWEPMVTSVTDKVTCPECRQRIDGGPVDLDAVREAAFTQGYNAGCADAKAGVEHLADWLGSQPEARNVEQGCSGEYETWLDLPVEVLADRLLAVVADPEAAS